MLRWVWSVSYTHLDVYKRQAKSGAYTGELSADMLKACGVEYVVIGHSERRQYFGETDVTVQKRVRAALDAGLTVILCVGETLEQREQGITSELVSMQTKIALGGVSEEELKRVIIAYEPVWAIGTGKTATAQQANEVCHTIRECIASVYSQAAADGITIQYGGSMNAGNGQRVFQFLFDADFYFVITPEVIPTMYYLDQNNTIRSEVIT